MFRDAFLLLSSAQLASALSSAGADNASTDYLDTAPLGNSLNTNSGRDIGNGEGLFLRVGVTTAFTTGSATTLQVGLQTSSTSAFSSTNDLMISPSLTSAQLATAGFEVLLPIPPDYANVMKRYVRGMSRSLTGAWTAGAYTIEIVKNIQKYKSYKTGFKIS